MSGIKRVLIAGATGNIGQHLCKALTAKGYDVSIVTRKPAEGKQDLPKLSWVSVVFVIKQKSYIPQVHPHFYAHLFVLMFSVKYDNIIFSGSN